MSVSEYERHHLFTWFEEHMGPERAATMMNLVPPVGWADVATRRDLAELEARLDARFDTVDARFETMGARFDAIDRRLDVEIDAKLAAMAGQLRSDLLRTFGTWLFASQAAVIAAVSVLVTLG